jgi:ABC-type nitrate/sulfonate/bicarbonate transport system substrate-binding protein
MVRALLKGQTYIRTNRAQAVAMIAHYAKTEEKDAKSDYDHIQGGIARDGTVPTTVQGEEIALRSEMVDVPPAQQMKAAAIFDFGPARKALADLNAKGWKPTP